MYNVEHILRSHGLRATAQRLLICGEILDAGHIDIDTLYTRLKKKIISLSLATVYKNIHSLMEAGIVSELNVEGKKTLYELNIHQHIHHICDNCGKIEDLHIETEDVREKIASLSGRNIIGCKITVYGKCSDCA
ncbi:Fur family transcriptional regulator [Seleniivibrio woodruffii]|uniref:Fur family peroxide stress response transcriptional regulator n=2 Tax=Seleniivibrio woodruffii TaxID=1078050 RepID=A0A4R1K9B7_9BACT|nr:Fur family transcriptional regulator [Seleniivibrio woodruffii]TCK60945.1 Fur family peroxide stress response transcriptional regulator [Seleniivibrio woodruffii]TVZ36575.1 Fur family peroxide stress response transcriptional regulator [Seleniivibrio woodruffii]